MELILDLLFGFLDFFPIGSSSKKKKYFKVDRIIEDWAKKVGLQQQYDYKDEKVRSFSVIDDAGNSYQIWIESQKWRRLKVSTTNNKSRRKRKLWNKRCKISNLTRVLFEAYGVTEQWISESGNRRTIKKKLATTPYKINC